MGISRRETPSARRRNRTGREHVVERDVRVVVPIEPLADAREARPDIGHLVDLLLHSLGLDFRVGYDQADAGQRQAPVFGSSTKAGYSYRGNALLTHTDTSVSVVAVYVNWNNADSSATTWPAATGCISRGAPIH